MNFIIIRIIYANMIPFLALISLLFMVKANPLFANKQSRLFCNGILLVMTILIVVSLGALFEYSDYQYAWIIRKIATLLNFITSPLIPLLIYQIYAKEKLHKLIYIIFWINTLLCLGSLFFGFVFDVTSNNTYSRGPLFFVPFTISMFYIFLLIIKAGGSRKKGKVSEGILLVWIVCLQILCLFFEVVFNYRFLTWDAAAMSLILYYLLININNSKYDALTGIYNRAMYNKRLAAIENASPCVIAVIDINNFKQINDLYGHAAGDKFLIRFSQLMQESLEKGMLLFRIGGDEFAILSSKKSEDELEVFLGKILAKTNEEKIDFAYGTALYEPPNSLDDALHIADQRMYVYKNKKKGLT